ncbi:TatD family hydrolase [Parvibacter caecicola]|uniref:TatD family deoxyribonuclease n=1 Tax=Parvibacter caecicola TaxID=747645 RepID=A0A4T9TA29_9ACTN|nr:TatD family hydrolase [Parvibacter caecicola]TJW12415.1 TatD family deoxyribonuclease [Parvibacter caecicola]
MTRFDDDLVYFDLLFRQPRRHGKWRPVEAPVLGVPVADTHAHLQLLASPPLALARAAHLGVDFLCTIVDVWEDGDATFEHLEQWQAQARALLGQLRALPAGESGPVLLPGQGLAPEGLPAVAKSGADAEEPPLLSPGAVRIAVGCHPHNASHWDDALEARLRRLLADGRVAALGEVGLDYHYDFSPRDAQQDVFRRQIAIAHEFDLPLVLHMREAHDEGFAILEEEGFPEAGVLLHCFNLDATEVRRWVERGCYVAFGGPATFKNADEVREAVRQVPLERLLTETDAPYMTPEPMRGIACEPAHTIFTAAVLCAVRGFGLGTAQAQEFLAQLYSNAQRLLNRPRPLA